MILGQKRPEPLTGKQAFPKIFYVGARIAAKIFCPQRRIHEFLSFQISPRRCAAKAQTASSAIRSESI